MAHLEPLMEKNFLEYASYVIIDRAIPDIRDGLKPVQRRLLSTLFEINDGRFHKVANVVGETMKLHPHGNASIEDALTVLANKEYFIEKQGNFGSVLTGHRAAAPRYIECRLTPLALENLFNKNLTEYAPSYDGRKNEPVFLPGKLPTLLMLGTEGIAVGMSTKILPHNFPELLQAQINILRKEPFEVFPDFIHGGVMDVSGYEDGLGSVKVRAVFDKSESKEIVIREIPYGSTTDSVINSIESAAQRGKIKISSIHDYTTDRVEIKLTLPRGVNAKETIPQLCAYTDCEVTLSSNMVGIRDRRPVIMSVSEVLRVLTKQLKDLIKAELEYDLGQLEDRQHWLTLEQIFIEKRVYKRLEDADTEKKITSEVYAGMEPFAKFFLRAMNDDDVTKLLEIRIRRISAFDIERNRKQIEEVQAKIKEIQRKLKSLTKTTIAYLEGLLKKYKAQYPRRTKIKGFETVDKKAVARRNIKLIYDPNSGFFGSDVKGDGTSLTVSEYDRILAVLQNGTYRIFGPCEKEFMESKVLYVDVFDPDVGVEFTVVYRDAQKICYGKRIRIEKFIKDKEYELIKGKKGKVDLLIQDEDPGVVNLVFSPAPRQRVKESTFDLSELTLTSPTARGTRLAPKAVSKVKRIKS